MATYVLVHGGGHGGWCYQRVARILRKFGHEVYAPTMTGLGERSHLLDHDVDLQRHIEDVAAVLHYEDLREVILVGHSYGGMVITGVADRSAERVGRARLPRRGDASQRTVVASTWPDRSSRRSVPLAKRSTGWSWCCSPHPTQACSTG